MNCDMNRCIFLKTVFLLLRLVAIFIIAGNMVLVPWIWLAMSMQILAVLRLVVSSDRGVPACRLRGPGVRAGIPRGRGANPALAVYWIIMGFNHETLGHVLGNH